MLFMTRVLIILFIPVDFTLIYNLQKAISFFNILTERSRFIKKKMQY